MCHALEAFSGFILTLTSFEVGLPTPFVQKWTRHRDVK